MDFLKKAKFILFDVANTLLEKKELLVTIDFILKKAGYDIPIEVIEYNHKLLSETLVVPSKTTKEFYLSFNSRLLDCLGISDHKSLASEIFRECSGMSWEAYDDVNFLRDITGDFKYGIISNWDKTLRKTLQLTVPLEFEFVISSIEEGVQKPDSKIYGKAISLAGCHPSEIVYVGDSFKLDYLPAMEMKLNSILIDRTGFYSFFAGNKVRSLESIVDKINNRV